MVLQKTRTKRSPVSRRMLSRSRMRYSESAMKTPRSSQLRTQNQTQSSAGYGNMSCISFVIIPSNYHHHRLVPMPPSLRPPLRMPAQLPHAVWKIRATPPPPFSAIPCILHLPSAGSSSTREARALAASNYPCASTTPTRPSSPRQISSRVDLCAWYADVEETGQVVWHPVAC
ncbi:hypothetical protein CYLTODRAFT_205318 [Cylindrobasidium torrendii FP15055 ss-10]|uniref:Uncharacterized protein n=1 Tax=Cylindrobasidium torrendii FP15055 ss-10 TaxID=1314674 RepID=A0A0D7ATS0_9AGAR|nr:hypothetical protein CYLTODRAFT_205318 [Cylindrobasidium torrendii FP15055 ss-10]